METEFQNALGKSTGEVIRDIGEFLAHPCLINPARNIDLRQILPDLNMNEQFSFALLSEAELQGRGTDATERFYRHTCVPVMGEATVDAMLSAFRNKTAPAYLKLRAKYGADFSMGDSSYWSTALALAIDAGHVEQLMTYLRLFTVCLMEFAYMEDRNPETTYTWAYYESFRRMLDTLMQEPEPETPILPLAVRAMGGTTMPSTEGSYYLSLGVDVENPNADRMALDVTLDITLKDRDGGVITVIRDTLQCIDPATVYHYGITKKIRGKAVAGFSAKVSAKSHLKLSTPIMNHVKLSELRMPRTEDGTLRLSGKLFSDYDTPLRSLVLHYQLLSKDNKILGGGSEWFFDGLASKTTHPVSLALPVAFQGIAKAVHSVDFTVNELL